MQPMAAILILGFYVFQSALRRILGKKKGARGFLCLASSQFRRSKPCDPWHKGEKKKKKKGLEVRNFQP
jgi:hypothetical protein